MIAFRDLPDLALERFGGAVLLANDEFFAPKEGLLKAAPAVWKEGEYTDRGKWMDGWETRRRRDAVLSGAKEPAHDWCIVRLGFPGAIHGVIVDTAFFKGNFPEHCSIEAATIEGTPTLAELGGEGTKWTSILAKSALRGDAKNEFTISGAHHATHLRFSIFPDGGVARLRVHGEPAFDKTKHRAGAEVDLAAMENGGLALSCSDMFFGDRHNLIQPGRSTHMGDGWETKRRRGPGNDWVVIRLAARGTIHRIELDTDHFKGNAPASCMVETVDATSTAKTTGSPTTGWEPLLPQSAGALQPHGRFRFEALAHSKPSTHVRLSIYPDGGVARLRVFGTLV